MPFRSDKGVIHKEWRITAEDRENALAKRHHTNMETLNEHVKELKPLAGNHGKRWARTGTVVETGLCCVDGCIQECKHQKQEVSEDSHWGCRHDD